MTDGPNLAARGTRMAVIGSALQSTDTRLLTVIDGVKGILADGSWREFVTSRGEHVQHERFADFVAAPMLRGLGVTVDLIRRVVADDPVALDLLDRTLQNDHGGDRRSEAVTQTNVDNIHVGRPSGTSESAALRRLRKESESGNAQAAALRADVLAGRLSAHQAMVRAGFRRRTFTVPVDLIEKVIADDNDALRMFDKALGRKPRSDRIEIADNGNNVPNSDDLGRPDTTITVVVFGLPAPQGSKRHVGRGVLVESSAKVRPWRLAVKSVVEDVIGDRPPLTGPLTVVLIFTLPKPASAPKRRRTWPNKRPDLDKLIRAVFDAVTESGAWLDDAQVVSIDAEKTYTGDPDALPRPGVQITIAPVTDNHPTEMRTL